MAEVPSKRRIEGNGATAVKQRRHYHHKHKPNVRQQKDQQPEAINQDERIVASQLERAVQLVLEAVGYTHAEPAALESLRTYVQACESTELSQKCV